MDADEQNLEEAKTRLRPWGDCVHLIHANFRELAELGLPKIDILFADLGVSSTQLDDPSRGFTFRQDAPLDLRFDRSRGIKASEFLAKAGEQEIKDVLRTYGELRGAGKLASMLYRKARRKELRTTMQLRSMVEDVYGYRTSSLLPQVFQALRMHVNDELGALHSLLSYGPSLLKLHGRFGVISYHSLEDRAVKQVFRALSTGEKDPRTGAVKNPAAYELLTAKVIRPSEEEVRRNPRSRSARLRAIRRLA